MQIIQEVAAARHVLVICGSTEIDGYAFCLGLDTFMGLHRGPPALHGLIRSVTYLIRGAIFRPKYTTSGLGRFSLNICSLGELMDMYHTHEATKRHDKLYALLGMSSDDISKASLLPNYDVPWKELLQRLVKFLLGEQVSVETWDNREMAVIKGKGGVIGRVSSVERNWDDRQNVHINFTNALRPTGYSEKQNAPWTLQVSAKAIQNGDLVCLLQGASKPTVIRPCKDYFVVVMMVATPPAATGMKRKRFRQPKLSQPILDFPHNFKLVWDWEESQETQHNRQTYLTFLTAQGEMQENLKAELEDHTGIATGFQNTALILSDAEYYEEAKEKFREAISGYERALGKEHPQTLTAMEALASMYHKTKHWKEEEELLLLVIQTKQSIEGANDGDSLNTLGTMDSLMSAYLDQGESGKAEIQKMKIELYRLQGNPIPEDVVLQAVESRSVEVLALLLNQKGDQIQITEEVVKAAAENEKRGLEVMTLLLDQRGTQIQITEEVVKAAAGNSWSGLEVITLLFNQRGDQIPITEEVVKVAAGNLYSGPQIMKLLLDQRGDQIQITEEIVKVAAGNNVTGLEVMTLLLDQRGDQIPITESKWTPSFKVEKLSFIHR
jgi:tetratricopeptide (TPR) repeat protein